LKPACFYDLVIEVAIVRPGRSRAGWCTRTCAGGRAWSRHLPSAAVKEVLERTLGVPIFQEQVMQLAIVAAGFTPGEADHLRRSMAAWRRKGGLEKFEQRLIDGMGERGYGEAFARQIYQQILASASTAFPNRTPLLRVARLCVGMVEALRAAAFCGALLNSLRWLLRTVAARGRCAAARRRRAAGGRDGERVECTLESPAEADHRGCAHRSG